MMNNYQPMYGNFGMYGSRNFGYPYQQNQNMQQPQQPIQPIQPITTNLGLQGKEEKKEEVKIDYLTKDDLSVFAENNNSLKNEIGSIRNQIEGISGNINQLMEEMRNFKGGRK